jgi:Family of unknown function (DUF5706)
MVNLTGEHMTGEAVVPLAPPRDGYPANSIHLVRTLQQITMQLSQMADQKASILMGATFVVFTVAIGQSSRTDMPIALSVLAFFAFVSAVLAVTAVLPRVTPQERAVCPNILFFGNFSRMSEDDFVAAVQARLHSDQDMLETMLRDIHQNGSILAARKYRYLALGYRTFVVGLSLTLIVFLAERAMLRFV